MVEIDLAIVKQLNDDVDICRAKTGQLLHGRYLSRKK